MNADAVILDGYVDEPACLGVPPYLSPYVRTVAGVCIEHGYRVRYVTIDQVRGDPQMLREFSSAAFVLVIAGVTVPGKYLGGSPATLTEIQQAGSMLRGTRRLIAGPIGFGFSPEGGKKAIKQEISGFDRFLPGSPAEALDRYLSGDGGPGIPDYSQSDRWAVLGSPIITQHPSFPFLMCELETARGCSRHITGGCSFCTEPLYGPPRYRSPEGIGSEVAALYKEGARHFRLGRQPDLLVYGAKGGEFPAPRPGCIRELFETIRSSAPDLKTLHIDNVNPGTIARHEEASREVLQEIVAGHTPGDVAAFGMETADPAVVAANNLKADPEQVMDAIRIVNEIGGGRKDGIPDLLPGLNFVTGLAGETLRTFDLNERFLREVLESGLLVRRINIRQVMPFEGTRVYQNNTLGCHEARFRSFKEFVRNQIDTPLLSRVFPVGTVLREVIIEKPGDISFGRQMGSYPILVGIPFNLKARMVTDVVVVSHGMRSVTGFPVPVRPNDLPLAALRWIPGVGKKKAGMIAVRRPFSSHDQFRAIAGPTVLDPFLEF
ncbi:MAG: radical SAM protein [Methanoregulaceae archaeon]|nr:radical SAM protein [Methanoregulaceae archaeon]